MFRGTASTLSGWEPSGGGWSRRVDGSMHSARLAFSLGGGVARVLWGARAPQAIGHGQQVLQQHQPGHSGAAPACVNRLKR